MQIRFADTQPQKQLKQTTQAARSFRSAECESTPCLSHERHADRRQDEFATSAWRQGRLPYTGTTLNDMPNATSEFDQYLGTTAGVPFQNQRWAQQRQFPARQTFVNQGQQAMYRTSTSAGAETGHEHSVSETTIEAKPTSPAHDSVKAEDQVE